MPVSWDPALDDQLKAPRLSIGEKPIEYLAPRDGQPARRFAAAGRLHGVGSGPLGTDAGAGPGEGWVVAFFLAVGFNGYLDDLPPGLQPRFLELYRAGLNQLHAGETRPRLVMRRLIAYGIKN